ncbi:hypothetical protein ACHAW5_010817 [Stephanodiscus triporus]|uniref:Uncharacterized protein n=1 Tax=Stephanodiscus triporus TaxID=2934178 RepID=A0ABD3N311_9STRA
MSHLLVGVPASSSLSSSSSSYRGSGRRRTTTISALLAGCLTASYIGGTVNFYATARAIKDEVMNNDADVVAMGGAFGSMAAADLVVMAIYFAMLQAASRSAILRRLFPSDREGGGVVVVGVGVDRDDGRSDAVGEGRGGDGGVERAEAETSARRGATVSAAALASTIALALVAAATRLERRVTETFPPPFNPPGTMCAFLALFGLAVERSIGFVLRRCGRREKRATKAYEALGKIPDVAPVLSDACFHLLFAAVGSAADLSSAVSGGPAALAFASVALLVHSVTTVALAWAIARLGTRSTSTSRWWSTTWEELLTASNAAIGGPSTAAAFAAGLIPCDNDGSDVDVERSNNRRSALVLAATFWGVFGYAIATGIGVTVSRLLIRWS